MTISTVPPPLKAEIVNKDKKITPIYNSFSQSIYDKLGSSRGDVAIANDSITNVSNTASLNLDASASLNFNGTEINQTYTADSIFKAIGSNVVKLTNYLDSGLDYSTGTILLGIFAIAPTNWILLNDGTIGNASSGATNRANADTEDLFTVLWNNISNTYCPVSGGRGASAAADFAAGKTIQLPLTRGRALGVAGAGSGLTSRATGETAGAETHVLSIAEMVAHTHTWTQPFIGGPYWRNTLAAPFDRTSGSGGQQPMLSTTTTSATGSGTAHNNVEPTVFLNGIIKL